MCRPASRVERSYRLLGIHRWTPVRPCRDHQQVPLKAGGFRLSSHWDFRPPMNCCWLDSSRIGIGLSTCCHHHNLPLWIIMAEKQGSLWASTAPPCRTAFLLFFLVWTRKDTRSKHAEPGRCDGLHWDLWGIGGHGDGLLCLLVSFDEGFLVKLGRLLAVLTGPK